jgi:hypothetical protein
MSGKRHLLEGRASASVPLDALWCHPQANSASEAALAKWRMVYTSSTPEHERCSTHESLDKALAAAWALGWEEGDVLRIEGPHGEKMDATTIANHPRRPE